MRVKILGCSGGIGGNLRTTSMLVDEDILIDAGTGVGDLSMDELIKIDHILITHSHLDHIAFIPLLIDTVMGFREEPITVHASKDTLATLRNHIFNWKVWPDFSMIPDVTRPFLKYNQIELGETLEFNGRKFTSVPANHVVSAVGYHVEGKQHSLVFTGDTTICEALWPVVNGISNLKYLIIETAFSNGEMELARLSKHLCPSMLISELGKLKSANGIQVFITHLKPGEGDTIMQEIADCNLSLPIKALESHQVFDL
jgi:ribonuclease BN (tRNA processing enzyme)